MCDTAILSVSQLKYARFFSFFFFFFFGGGGGYNVFCVSSCEYTSIVCTNVLLEREARLLKWITLCLKRMGGGVGGG